MRQSLFLFFFLFSLQAATAQEVSNPLITFENAHLLSPLYNINEEFFMASFSQFEHDGTAVLLVDSDHSDEEPPMQSRIRTWDLETQEITNTITFESFGGVYGPMQMPVHSKVATISVGGSVDILNYPDASVHRQFNSSSSYYTIAAISVDGRRLVFTQCIWREFEIGCYDDSWSLSIIDTETFEQINRLSIEPFHPLQYFQIHDLALSNDGRYLLLQASTGETAIYDTITSERLAIYERLCGNSSVIARANTIFVNTEQILVSKPVCQNGIYQNDRLLLWNYVTGEERILFNEPNSIHHFDLSPENTLVGILSGSKLYLVNFSTGEILKEIDATTFNFDFSPDGRYLLHGNTIYGIENE